LIKLHSAAAFKRSSFTILADSLFGFIPGFIFRQTIHLPLAAMRAVSTFRGVTERLIKEKTVEFQTQGGEVGNDLLNLICMLPRLSPIRSLKDRAKGIANQEIPK
jgi:hypothetical protein